MYVKSRMGFCIDAAFHISLYSGCPIMCPVRKPPKLHPKTPSFSGSMVS